MIKKLTKKVMRKYGITIDSQVIERPLIGKSLTLYTIESEQLKINWSNVGSDFLKSAKKDLLSIINS